MLILNIEIVVVVQMVEHFDSVRSKYTLVVEIVYNTKESEAVQSKHQKP